MVVSKLTRVKFQMCLISILLVLDITLLSNYHLLSTHLNNEYLTNNCLPNSFNFEPIIPTD